MCLFGLCVYVTFVSAAGKPVEQEDEQLEGVVQVQDETHTPKPNTITPMNSDTVAGGPMNFEVESSKGDAAGSEFPPALVYLKERDPLYLTAFLPLCCEQGFECDDTMNLCHLVCSEYQYRPGGPKCLSDSIVTQQEIMP